MKAVIASLLAMMPSIACAQIHAQYFWSDFTQSPQGMKQMTVEPLEAYTVYGTNIVTGDRIRRTTSAVGSTTVSNIVPGSYRVQIVGSSGTTTFTNSFGTNVSGLVNAKDYLDISTNLPAGQVAYSQAQADGRFASLAGQNNFSDSNYFGAEVVIIGDVQLAGNLTVGAGTISGGGSGLTSVTASAVVAGGLSTYSGAITASGSTPLELTGGFKFSYDSSTETLFITNANPVAHIRVRDLTVETFLSALSAVQTPEVYNVTTLELSAITDLGEPSSILLNASNTVALGSLHIATNSPGGWPTQALSTNQPAIVTSNNAVYVLSTVFNSRAWGATNRLSP